MGLRFRKSIGKGPFRINFSKSGVGYSFGSKFFRVTKKADGGTRTTASIPGTGVSYVKDRGKTATPKDGQNAETRSKSKKPFYKKWWFWLIIVLLIIGAASGGGDNAGEVLQSPAPSTVEQETPSPAASPSSSPDITPSQSAEMVASAAPAVVPDEAESPEPQATMVWLPESGAKYHSKPDCSGMDNPRQVTKDEAIAMGYEPCKRCY